VCFVAVWAIAGATAAGYSPTEDAISELARSHEPTQLAMTLGFLVFGSGVFGFGLALRSATPGAAGLAAMATGLSTLGVAAFPLGSPAMDRTHGVFAAIGYGTLTLTPLLAAGPLHRAGRREWARYSLVTAGVVAGCLLVSAFAARNGLWQRAGLTTGDVWIVACAVALLRRRWVVRTP
jgi:hypothetical protein